MKKLFGFSFIWLSILCSALSVGKATGSGLILREDQAHFQPGAFVFGLDGFVVFKTRSRHEDTVFVAAGLKVGGTDYGVTTVAMGDLNGSDDGTAYCLNNCRPARVIPFPRPRVVVGELQPPKLSFGPVTIADPKTLIRFSYEITNCGNDVDVAKKLRDSVAELNQKIYKQAIGLDVPKEIALGTGLPILDFAIQKIAFANCDGVTAVDQVSITADQFNSPRFSQTRTYKGYDSPNGCGANSRYDVTWSVTRR